MKYIAHYPAHIQDQVKSLIEQDKLGLYLQQKYPEAHQIQSDKALYQYVTEIKNRHMKNVGTLSQVSYNSKLKSHNSITVASVFKEAPLEFLQMIVVHELAHFKESEHNKAFYQLCCHMQPDYHQIELDMRLWLLWRDLQKSQG